MKLIATPLPGVFEAEATPIVDHRGQFTRLFCLSSLSAAHANRPIVQINHSMTRTVGAIRGLHYQRAPKAEAKWVRCLRGRVWDVAVDMRCGSPTFLSWHVVELDAKRMNAVFIPEGCAHGFQVLETDSELLYLHTAPYTPGLEGGARWDDPRLSISWPLPATDISDRDKSHTPIEETFEGIVT